MEVVRKRAWFSRGQRESRKADAEKSQEEEKVGRRQFRGIHRLCIPSGRRVGGEDDEIAPNGATVEASPGRKGSNIACFKNCDTQAVNLFESELPIGVSPSLLYDTKPSYRLDHRTPQSYIGDGQ